MTPANGETQRIIVDLLRDDIKDLRADAERHHREQREAIESLKRDGLPMCKVQAQKLDDLKTQIATIQKREPLSWPDFFKRLGLVTAVVSAIVAGVVQGVRGGSRTDHRSTNHRSATTNAPTFNP